MRDGIRVRGREGERKRGRGGGSKCGREIESVREGGGEGGKERRRKGGREGGKEGRSEGERKGGRGGARKGGREGRRKEERGREENISESFQKRCFRCLAKVDSVGPQKSTPHVPNVVPKTGPESGPQKQAASCPFAFPGNLAWPHPVRKWGPFFDPEIRAQRERFAGQVG